MRQRGTFLSIATCAGLLCGAGNLALAQQAPSDQAASSTVSAQDTKLEKKIDYRLQHDQKLKARNVDASVSNGMVTLTGTVRTSSEKARAERLARTKGVSDVDNQIQIEGQEAAPQGAAATPDQQPREDQGGQAPSEAQPPAQPEGNVQERTTRTEERTETRTERTPMPPQGQQQSTPTNDIPRPAQPTPPSQPSPAPRSPAPQQ